jgi:multimeric flavodoxin WrbA
MTSKSSFDLDFSYGRKGEQLVEELLTEGKRIEVKRDRKWHLTGNVYIEVECFFTKNNEWAPSGLAVTEAEYWAFVLKRQSLCYQPQCFGLQLRTLGKISPARYLRIYLEDI